MRGVVRGPHTINERLRRDRRAGAAIQLVFLRASGHTLDHVGTLPRELLRYVGERIGLPTASIASLRTLYQRYKTQYEHQVWACEYLGLTSMGADQWSGLEAWMRQDAAESLALDGTADNYEALLPWKLGQPARKQKA
ncbi:DUF4158 domain-containing protein [Burkholderia sp. JSH-S8]|nr:DUF4158 domain-containing protein [Burkholderia sp. JSH-S8]